MLANQGVITLPQIEEKPSEGGRPSKEYIFIGEQGKRDSIIVVAQLSPEFTARIVDRWMELERVNSRMPTELEMLAILANKAVEQERKIAQHEATLETHTSEIDILKAQNAELREELKLYRDEEEYFTAKAAANMYNVKNLTQSAAQKLGYALSKLSREMGYEVQRRKHTDFNDVGAYHIDVIRELFEVREYEVYS